MEVTAAPNDSSTINGVPNFYIASINTNYSAVSNNTSYTAAP